MERWNIIKRLKDGTVIYRNPFTGTEAWYLPERKHRPFYTDPERASSPLLLNTPQNYCAFCPANYIATTPEKSRIEFQNGEWFFYDSPGPAQVFAKEAEFRRIGNLYEIISTNFWGKNYDYKISPESQKQKEAYLADSCGRDHVRSLFAHKFKNIEEVAHQSLRDEDVDHLADAFFGGSHELIIPRRHYIENATETSQLCSTGELTADEHYQYIRLTCHAVKSIYATNPFVKFVAVYTNWRRDAGASFEHLHRQVIGLDRFGNYINRAMTLTAGDIKIYQDYVNYVAKQLGLILCENDYAVAFADVGHTFSTVAIYSKSRYTFPWNHSAEELRGMSDVLHAVHAAFGPNEAVNEEWYYQAPSCPVRIPWHILVKWRNHRHAGIENITDIFPDEYGPVDLKNRLLGKLYTLRSENKIAVVLLDSECARASISLNYFKDNKPEPIHQE